MPLTDSTLASGLEAMTPVDNEPDAISALATAFHDYFAEASVLGVPTNGGSLAGAKSAFEAAAVGLSANGAGALAIQNAITAFWGQVAASAATIWTPPPPIPPPTAATPPASLAGIAAALTAVFAANLAAEADLASAAADIATAIHATQAGGIALIPPPPPPTNPGPQPIL
jgi:hypothetical protein